MTRVMTVVLANGYVADGKFGGEWDPQGEYWIEGDPVSVEVEPDGNEEGVRVGVMVPDSDQEVAGLYFSPSSARDLMVGIGAALREIETA